MKAIFTVVIEDNNLTNEKIESMKEDLDEADTYLIDFIKTPKEGDNFIYVSYLEKYPFEENEDNV